MSTWYARYGKGVVSARGRHFSSRHNTFAVPGILLSNLPTRSTFGKYKTTRKTNIESPVGNAFPLHTPTRAEPLQSLYERKCNVALHMLCHTVLCGCHLAGRGVRIAAYPGTDLFRGVVLLEV